MSLSVNGFHATQSLAGLLRLMCRVRLHEEIGLAARLEAVIRRREVEVGRNAGGGGGGVGLQRGAWSSVSELCTGRGGRVNDEWWMMEEMKGEEEEEDARNAVDMHTIVAIALGPAVPETSARPPIHRVLDLLRHTPHASTICTRPNVCHQTPESEIDGVEALQASGFFNPSSFVVGARRRMIHPRLSLVHPFWVFSASPSG